MQFFFLWDWNDMHMTCIAVAVCQLSSIEHRVRGICLHQCHQYGYAIHNRTIASYSVHSHPRGKWSFQCHVCPETFVCKCQLHYICDGVKASNRYTAHTVPWPLRIPCKKLRIMRCHRFDRQWDSMCIGVNWYPTTTSHPERFQMQTAENELAPSKKSDRDINGLGACVQTGTKQVEARK